VNFIDTYKRGGIYKVQRPFTPGSEASGTVEEVGDGVTGFSPGDRVATAEGIDCYAEFALVDEDKALPCRTAWTISRPPRCRCRA
jgi:NADPH2:quinone reductase